MRRLRRVLTRPGDNSVAALPVCVGIDPSLVGTGVAVVRGGKLLDCYGWTNKKTLADAHPTRLVYYKVEDQDDTARCERLCAISDWIGDFIETLDDQAPGRVHVAVEGYAMSRLSLRATDLHELGGLLKIGMWRANVPYRIYDPLSVKLAWTGDGHAKKPEMMRACWLQFGHDFGQYGAAGENLADAFLIAKLLETELLVKRCPEELGKLTPSLQRVLARVTKSEPIPLLKRLLVQRVP